MCACTIQLSDLRCLGLLQDPKSLSKTAYGRGLLRKEKSASIAPRVTTASSSDLKSHVHSCLGTCNMRGRDQPQIGKEDSKSSDLPLNKPFVWSSRYTKPIEARAGPICSMQMLRIRLKLCYMRYSILLTKFGD